MHSTASGSLHQSVAGQSPWYYPIPRTWALQASCHHLKPDIKSLLYRCMLPLAQPIPCLRMTNICMFNVHSQRISVKYTAVVTVTISLISYLVSVMMPSKTWQNDRASLKVDTGRNSWQGYELYSRSMAWRYKTQVFSSFHNVST